MHNNYPHTGKVVPERERSRRTTDKGRQPSERRVGFDIYLLLPASAQNRTDVVVDQSMNELLWPGHESPPFQSNSLPPCVHSIIPTLNSIYLLNPDIDVGQAMPRTTLIEDDGLRINL